MLPDVEAFASEVAHTINQALTPVLERLAAAEARLQVLGDVRDRVVAMEAKAAIPPLPPPEPSQLDLSPVLERMAGAEARLNTLGDLRDRVVAMETKAAIPAQQVQTEPARVDLTPVMERLATADTRLARLAGLETTVGELRDRLLTIEAKADVADPNVDLKERLTAIERRVQDDMVLSETHCGALQRDYAGLSERVAVVETRAQVPGPAGKDGHNGHDGKDGADGLGFEDLSVEFDGDRTLALKFERGSQKKLFPIRLPFMRQEGVYLEGKTYGLGDVVTWGGSQWHANTETTTKPGDGSKDWTLIVKRGRDGKDGQDAKPIPVVSVGRAQ